MIIFNAGNPKGAMLTHENVIADAAGVLKSFEVCMKQITHQCHPHTSDICPTQMFNVLFCVCDSK